MTIISLCDYHILFLKYLVLVFPAGRNRNVVSESYLNIFIAGRYGKGAACRLCPFWVWAQYLLRAILRGLDRGGSCCHHKGGLSAYLASLLYESSSTAAELLQSKAAPPLQSSGYLCGALALGFLLPLCALPGHSLSRTHWIVWEIISREVGDQTDSRIECLILKLRKLLFLSVSTFFPFSSIRWS